MNSVAELMAVGTSLFAAWRAERLPAPLHADGDLHMRALAQQTEQHFQQLTAELLSAAKETDRDVWEQRNGQFQTLILAATLMFGVAMSAIIEGNFDAGAASRRRASRSPPSSRSRSRRSSSASSRASSSRGG